MKALLVVPNTLSERLELYGDPRSPDFASTHLIRVALPFPVRLSWAPKQTLRNMPVHGLVAEAMVDAIASIGAYRGPDWLRECDYDLWGGVYANRPIRGQEDCECLSALSTHAWGVAIDWCPHLGQLGEAPRMPLFIVEAFESRGFVWGGRWSRPDGMHFQACH